MKVTKKILVVILSMALILTLFPIGNISAVQKKVKLNKTKATIYVGKTVTLKLKNNNKTVKWSSSNKKVATVTKKGKVKGKKAGKVIIVAKVRKKKYKCKITVKKKVIKKNIPQSIPKPMEKSTQKPTEQVNTTGKKNIIDLTNVDNIRFYKETGIVKDSFANVYSNCYVASTLNDTYVVLYLAKKYSTLNLTIAPTEERHSGTITYTQIYADDELIYTSDSVTKTSKPVNLNLNVKNVDLLKIVEVRTTLGDYDKPTLYVGYVSE